MVFGFLLWNRLTRGGGGGGGGKEIAIQQMQKLNDIPKRIFITIAKVIYLKVTNKERRES